MENRREMGMIDLRKWIFILFSILMFNLSFVFQHVFQDVCTDGWKLLLVNMRKVLKIICGGNIICEGLDWMLNILLNWNTLVFRWWKFYDTCDN